MRWTPLLVLILCVSPAAAETYILPMYGVAGGTWYPRIAVLNPGDQPVTIRIVRGYPMVTGQCLLCTEHPELTIAPKGMISLRPCWSDTKEFVVAGTYELETSGPVLIEA